MREKMVFYLHMFLFGFLGKWVFFHTPPLNGVPALLHIAIWSVGLLFLIYQFIGSNFQNSKDLLMFFLKHLNAIWLLLFLNGEIQSLIPLLNQYPGESIYLFAFSALAAYLFSRLGLKEDFDKGIVVLQGGIGDMTSGYGTGYKKENWQQVSFDLVRTTSAHEVGHASLLACLHPSLMAELENDDVKLVLRMKKDDAGVYSADMNAGEFGFLVHPQAASNKKKSYFQYMMLLLLAGAASEKHFFGESAAGATSDMMKWCAYAELYLQSGMDERFVPYPEWFRLEGGKENGGFIGTLMREQREILAEFFRENELVIQEFSHRLQEDMELNFSQIRPYIEKLKPVKGMPLVDKPFW